MREPFFRNQKHSNFLLFLSTNNESLLWESHEHVDANKIIEKKSKYQIWNHKCTIHSYKSIGFTWLELAMSQNSYHIQTVQ